jgi:energy-coupling factor transporter transmembrane protein EcfT
MSTSQQRQVNLFRYVPSNSPAHRMWAGTKIGCLAVISLALFAKPTWSSIAVVAGVTALYALVARLPRGVAANPPRWIFIGLAIACFFTTLAFGPPNLHIGHFSIGLGGLLLFLRTTALGALLVSLGLLLGWTTELADVSSAVHRLAAPARFVRLPIDEIVLAIGLSVRCLPLLADDVRTLQAAWRVRSPVRKLSMNERVDEVRDLLIAALVSSLRRAREMGEAIDARGGPQHAPRDKVRLHLVDLVAIAVVLAAGAAIVLI